MKTLQQLLPGIFFCLFFLSCKKDNNNSAETPQKTLLSKAVYSAVGTYDYAYDASGKLKSETYSGNASNPGTLTTVTGYSSSGNVTSYAVHFTSGTATDYSAVVVYNSEDKIERIFNYTTTGIITGSTHFVYMSPDVSVRYFNAANSLTGSTYYKFSADGKNIVESRSYNSAATITSTTAYSDFDTKKTNDYLLPYGFYNAPRSENNWKTLTRYNHTVTPISTTVTNVSYTYNDDGYVIKRTSPSGTTIDYQYAKQ